MWHKTSIPCFGDLGRCQGGGGIHPGNQRTVWPLVRAKCGEEQNLLLPDISKSGGRLNLEEQNEIWLLPGGLERHRSGQRGQWGH